MKGHVFLDGEDVFPRRKRELEIGRAGGIGVHRICIGFYISYDHETFMGDRELHGYDKELHG